MVRGRLQRLNRAGGAPPRARRAEDWEILRDLLQEFYRQVMVSASIEDVFRQMAEIAFPPLAGLSLNKIGDLGVKVMATP